MDESTSKRYEEVMNGIVVGARRTSPIWPSFFSQTSGSFEERIRRAFNISGFLPTRTQFEREKTAIIYADSYASVVEEIPQPVPAPKKKKAEAKVEEVEEPKAEEPKAEEETDEGA